jgi:membrane protein
MGRERRNERRSDFIECGVRIRESRPWWKQKVTVVGLTVTLAVLIILALSLVLYGGKIGQMVAATVGLDDVFKIAWKIIHWALSLAAMFLSFSLVYYFGPDVRGDWHWVTPGAALGVAIWLLASFGFRIDLHFFSSYCATYGSLGAVIILLLWLYITGLAISIGAELNWVIEEEDKNTAQHGAALQKVQPQMKAAA